ncbi:MAG: FAD-dependent oxidoreductase [Candidatus Dadabacteria bacterium]|nr:NAD(P)/FAD-dependent oxidoreductase [Candidatus Dadabacteria bacterium]NIY22892.1 FAD-dependent oxidoreductase [Candidatus Dadabacteria bacterium]
MTQENNNQHRVVIIGGGFGGLYAAKELGESNIKLTLVDRRNFHLFQPLLYQVATGGLSPGDIASPLRAVLNKQENTKVYKSEVVDIDTESKEVILRYRTIPYDTLIVASGSSHHYFGNDNWAVYAPGLKTIEDALEFRKRIFFAFECAEKITDPKEQESWMTFVVIGGGPTGVELAGALGELANTTLGKDFRNIDTTKTKIILLEAADRILQTYTDKLSNDAKKSLEKLGVTVQTDSFVTGIDENQVVFKESNRSQTINSKTVLWAAGVRASRLGRVLHKRTGAEIDSIGRVVVENDLSIKNYPELLVIGDLANFSHQTAAPLPGVAPVAMQQGMYAAALIKKRIEDEEYRPFKYSDKGSLAVIGRNSAVASIGRFNVKGFFAWLIWLFIHIRYLVEYDNKVLVLTQWAWNYFTRKRGARLITGTDHLEILKKEEQEISNNLK